MTDAFLDYLRFEKRHSAHTVLAYSQDLQQFSAFGQQQQPDFRPEDAHYRHVRAWVISLMEGESQPRTVNRKVASLGAFFRFLMLKGLREHNPVKKLRALKTPARLPHFVKAEEMPDLLSPASFSEDFAGLRDRLVLELLYGAGLRRSELLGLRLQDVDLQARTLKVMGKRGKERIIPIPEPLSEILLVYLRERQATHPMLIVRNDGLPAYPGLVYGIARRYLSEHTSADRRSPHVLRHTFATHMLNEGAALNDIKELLGHGSLAATQVYTHNSVDRLRKVFEQAHPRASKKR